MRTLMIPAVGTELTLAKPWTFQDRVQLHLRGSDFVS